MVTGPTGRKEAVVFACYASHLEKAVQNIEQLQAEHAALNQQLAALTDLPGVNSKTIVRS